MVSSPSLLLVVLACALPALAARDCWGRTHSLFDNWCVDNCNHNPPNCNQHYCECADEAPAADEAAAKLQCMATGLYTGNNMVTVWCNQNCNHNPSYCPPAFCACHAAGGDDDDHSAGDWGYCALDDDIQKSDSEYLCDEDWADEHETCGQGQEQSPVDITVDPSFVIELTDAPPVTFSDSSCSSFTISRPDLSWGANFDDCEDSTIDFLGTTYTLSSAHIHAPSEHTFGGVAPPMELHMIHTTEASDVESILVIGIPLYLAGDKVDGAPSSIPWIDNLIPDTDAPASMNPYEGMPSGPWFTYEGSLTTPPCTEGLRWVVGAPGYVSHDLFNSFTAGLAEWPRTQDKAGNAREVQPLNGRVITILDLD